MATSSSSIQVEETRPQAVPLPTKPGEIGFRESLHTEATEVNAGTDNAGPLPLRHPADTNLSLSSAAPGVSTSVASSAPPPAQSGFLCVLFKPKKFRTLGIRSSTIILLTIQCTLFLLTIASWILIVEFVQLSSAALLVHIVFVITVISQIIFLERTTFRLRAERYAALHPGEIMPPTFLHRNRSPTRLALAPWNRPSLPTYAAVLADSGVGTGDVEDSRIAVPPPPAYGITRGSTLVMAGVISEVLRNESRQVRAERGERFSEMTEVSQKTASRPMSYVSHLSECEARCDMTRARILEETLCRLQSGEVSAARA